MYIDRYVIYKTYITSFVSSTLTHKHINVYVTYTQLIILKLLSKGIQVIMAKLSLGVKTLNLVPVIYIAPFGRL